MQTNPATDFLATNRIVECERNKAVLTIIACARRAAWDSNCAECPQGGRRLKDYGQHKCLCNRRVKAEGASCWLCGKEKTAPVLVPKTVRGARKMQQEAKCREEYVSKDKSRRAIGTCVKCGMVTRIHARGLGDSCYRREKRMGTLDANFPAKPEGGQRKVKA